MISNFKTFLFFGLIFAFGVIVFGQSRRAVPKPTPPDDNQETVVSEEVKVNLSALDINGKFINSLQKEDLVILEDNTLHQASSLRKVPASVLIVLDTGGENRFAKDISTTRKTAISLISSLQSDDSIGLLQYSDKVELLSEWTKDKESLTEILKTKLNFGKRSRFVEALDFAAKYFENSPSDNRHLVLITDGLDSTKTPNERNTAMKNILQTNINVHIISYTQMENAVVAERSKSVSGGGTIQKPLPPGANPPYPQTQRFPIVTVNMDREMIRSIRARGAELEGSQRSLTKLSEDTNGEIYLPNSREDMIAKNEIIAQNIDSQYVLTYVPKRSINDLNEDEIRVIEVRSRRAGVYVQAHRKLFLKAAGKANQ